MNWKDYTSLTAVVFVVVVIGAVILQLPVAQLSDWRPATVLLTLLALFIFFTISPVVAETSKPESITTALLGLSALGLALAGLIVNSQVLFVVFCVNLVILWSMTIYYHMQAENESRGTRRQ